MATPNIFTQNYVSTQDANPISWLKALAKEFGPRHVVFADLKIFSHFGYSYKKRFGSKYCWNPVAKDV
jgi:hypothetical protein